MADQFHNLQKLIGIKFKNQLLLKEALTHRSFINEHPTWPVPNNERLEFLGDAVLELAATEILFHKFKSYDEGLLTSIRSALVNSRMLARVAGDLKLEKYILLSKGESQGSAKAKESILGDAVEALIGAVYLDQGYEPARELVSKFVFKHLEKVVKNKLYRDPKSWLQEIIQDKLKLTPHYRVLEESGPDHNRSFTVGVFFGNTMFASGDGNSKQEAERSAAAAALKKLRDE